jgi:hypothetical protein
MKNPSLQQLALSDGIGWRHQGSNAMHIVQDLTKVADEKDGQHALC